MTTYAIIDIKQLMDYFFILPDEYTDELSDYDNNNSTKICNGILSYLAPDHEKQIPLLVFIGGASSTGKSSLAIELARLFGIRSIVSTDILRSTLSICCPNSPQILSYFSHESWKAVSDLYAPEALLKGFQLQCTTLIPAIENICRHGIRHRQNMIIEGVHLTPGIVRSLSKSVSANIVPLFMVVSQERLVSVLIPKRVKSTYMHRPVSAYSDERIERLSVLNEWWLKEIKENDFRYIVNDCDEKVLVDRATSYLAETISQLCGTEE